MASASTNNLFGEDTDSSDESVDATEAAATATKSGEGGDAAVDDAKGEESPEKKHGDEKDSEDSARGEDAKEAGGGTPSKSNSALFGDDDSSSSEDDEFDGNDGIVGRVGGDKSKAPPVGKSMNQKLGLDSDSDNEGAGTKPGGEAKEEEAPKQDVPPRRMEMLDLDPDDKERGSPATSNVEYHITKLPNLVGINSAPYDAVTHDAAQEEEHYRGYVHNMIRWRYKTDPAGGDGEPLRDGDGHLIRESNTRLVKWSDGSYTLHVGNEALEVDAQDSRFPENHPDPTLAGFTGINGYLYASKTAQIRPPKERKDKGPAEGAAEDDDDDEDGPPARPAGTVLECLGPIASRLAPRPSSLAGEAHRNLALAVRQRSQKRARIAEIVTEVDPEKEKLERIKGKDDLARSRDRKSGGRRGGGGRRRAMNAAYLEDEEEGAYDGVDIGRVKRRTMRRDRYEDDEDTEMDDYGDDASGEEEDEWTKKKGRKKGAGAARAESRRREEEEESSEEGEVVFGDDDDDDDEEDVAFVGKKRGGGAKKAVLDDDDDD